MNKKQKEMSGNPLKFRKVTKSGFDAEFRDAWFWILITTIPVALVCGIALGFLTNWWWAALAPLSSPILFCLLAVIGALLDRETYYVEVK